MAEIRESIEAFGLSKKDKSKSLFSKIGVVGCGREGHHVVSLVAQSGMEVVFIEVSKDKIEDALRRIESDLDTKIGNWGLTQTEKRAIMGKIQGSLDYADLRDCDFVVECIRYQANGEKSTELRKEVFRNLEKVLSPDAIIATNATTVIISELAAELEYKERCISLNFPTSHTDVGLLEIVGGAFTSSDVIERVKLFANSIKHTPIEVKESSGLVSMRLFATMLNEACQILMERLTSMENIDAMFTLGYGQRYGVFHLADIMGIEKIVMLMEDMFDEYGDKKYKASPILWRLYHSKQYGIHTTRGFYIYDEAGNKVGPNNI